MLSTADFIAAYLDTLPPSEVEKVKQHCNTITSDSNQQPKRNKRIAEPILLQHKKGNIKSFIISSLAITTPKPQGYTPL